MSSTDTIGRGAVEHEILVRSQTTIDMGSVSVQVTRADVVALSKTFPVVGAVGPSCAVQRRFPWESEETPASDFAAWVLFPLVVSFMCLH
jgi:hypothetical protein